MTRKVELPNFASDIRELIGKDNKLPPVESWKPEREGEIDIRIAKDGDWFYQGSKIERQALVQLFSSILIKDDTGYFLVTPVEKMKITVEDVPFIVRLVDIEGEGIQQNVHFSTNTGDCFTLSEAHPLTVLHNEKGEPAPYVMVRRNLSARLNRTVYYTLAEWVVSAEQNSEEYGIWSKGQFFIFS